MGWKILGEHIKQCYGVTLGVRQYQRILGQLALPTQTASLGSTIRLGEGRGSKKLRCLARRKDIELWSLDECHFQQHDHVSAYGYRPKALRGYV